MTHSIDAQNKRLGRVASEAARFLSGKESVNYAKNKITGDFVTITNASKLVISEKKSLGKKYVTYTMYPGGLKSETLSERRKRKGIVDVLHKAVRGMLPANKLRPRILKRLKITE